MRKSRRWALASKVCTCFECSSRFDSVGENLCPRCSAKLEKELKEEKERLGIKYEQ